MRQKAKSLILLLFSMCIFSLVVDASSLKEKLIAKNQVMEKRKSQLLPEPCYPPPCPGYNYETPPPVVATDTKQQTPDDGLVVAEHFGEGDDLSGDPMGAPPQTPNAGSANSGGSSVSSGYSASPGGSAPDSSLTNSVVSLAPPPSSFVAANHVHDANCAHAQSPELAEDLEKLQTLKGTIKDKESTIKVHNAWLSKAHDALTTVQNLVNNEEINKKSLLIEVQELRMKEQELNRRARRHQLEAALSDAKVTMQALETQSTNLKTTDKLLGERQSAIQNKIKTTLTENQLTQQELDEDLASNDKTNLLKNIAKQYDSYVD